jgi:hypothetical protein
LISENISLTLATGNGQVLIKPEPIIVGPLTALGMANAKGTETVDSHHYVLENVAYGQTGFAKYTEGRVNTLTATEYKRPEANLVVGQVTPSAE